MTTSTPLAIDRTVKLDINTSTQRVRLCAARPGLPTLLVVQAGPALPLLNEVSKFQRRLHLEDAFLVCYWEQRGCGDASQADATSVSLRQQVDDLREVLRWLHAETKQPVTVLGISIGATVALRAIAQQPDHVKAIVAISPDAHTARSDAAASAFLDAESLRAGSRRLRRRVMALAKPPYVNPAAIQRRAGLLADLGAIERRKTFLALLRESGFSMIRTYGILGAIRAVRNLDVVMRRLLPEIASLDLLADPPRVTIPVHYVFGEQDALTPADIVKALPAAIAAPGSTVRVLADAGHMLHFDQPEIVRSILVQA